MNSLNSKKGSQWRRWDLHIHTPETKLNDHYKNDGNVWDKYIDCLENSPVQAFGITDYFSADGYFSLREKYEKKYPETEKVFFPNIEFRLAEAISPENSNPHIHVIFDNDITVCSKDLIKRFLSELKTLIDNERGARISCDELNSKSQYEAATVYFEELKEALEKTFVETKPYLIAFPAKNNGLRSVDKESPRKVETAEKIDRGSHLFFGGSSSRDFFLQTNRYREGRSLPKPVVSESDAHSFDHLQRLEGNVSEFQPTWIKADLTFLGLKQICFEPEARVHIGLEPEVEKRKSSQATKFLAELKINQKEEYNGANGNWFKNVNIELNPELVAIIGNKGSGKSALVDIISLLGNSHQEENFSFLSNKKSNKKFRQRGYSENFTAELKWQSGSSVSKGLDEHTDEDEPEAVRYLPQNYFDKLTNEIEIEEFRGEIENVVFSHVEETDRMGMATFKDLQEFKTRQSRDETSFLKAKLRGLNIEIIDLEERKSPMHRKKLEGELKVKREELSSLESTKPAEVSKPDEESEEQKELTAQIERLVSRRNELASEEREFVDNLTQKKSQLQKLETLLQNVLSLGEHIERRKSELRTVCDELGLDIEQIVSSRVSANPVAGQIDAVKTEIQKLENDSNLNFAEVPEPEFFESLPDLRTAIKHQIVQIDDLRDKLGAPQRKYQSYLGKLAEWDTQKSEILGNADDPRPGTIKYLEKKIAYIDNELDAEIFQAYEEREKIVKGIFESKRKIMSFYSDLKSSVEGKLASARTDEFAIEIEASFVKDGFFVDDFLKLVNKAKRGCFHGTGEARNLFNGWVAEVDWNDFESIYAFFGRVTGEMSSYDGEPVLIRDQVFDIKKFYDFMFSLEYVEAKYELRLGGKNLNELSPGEKGLLLLVFYLQLDKDNIPLVIDQPEDNLDNESVFKVLAQCIRGAKKARQVVLVTHNPNLAVGADAEQIIFVKLEKEKEYKFSYETGAIEHPRIKRRIIDILEGSQPAFTKRRLKYQI